MKSPTIRDAALEARAIAEPLEAKQTEKMEKCCNYNFTFGY